MDQPGTGWAPNTALCSRWGSYSTTVQTYALRVATRVLWTATGRQFGLNSVTVRPTRPAQQPLYRTYPAGYQGYGYWTLFGVNGGDAYQIVNTCGCGSTGGTGVSACSCGGADISIPDDVNSITSVVIDGVLLDPSKYVLLGGYLTRTDGLTWPYVQDFSLVAGATGTWSITYLQGIPVPADLNDAAGLYACQVGAAATGGTCQLPNRVQQVTRNGLDITYIDPGNYLENNRTGYDAVDMIINSYNPHGLTQRPRVLSLDTPQFRR
jgi:hypothetical protein